MIQPPTRCGFPMSAISKRNYSGIRLGVFEPILHIFLNFADGGMTWLNYVLDGVVVYRYAEMNGWHISGAGNC